MPITPYLNQCVVKKITKSYTVDGVPEPEISANISCRIQSSTKRLVINGVEFTAEAEIWLKPAEIMDVDDVIVWEGNKYKVVKMDVKKGLTGATHHKKGWLVSTKE